jgi:mRNA interferase MazF
MARRTTIIRPKRGEIYLGNFDPTIGAEIQKTRPALVIQNDIANRHSPVTIVAAISSQFDESLYPTEIFIQPPEGGLSIPSVVLLNQIRSIDKRQLWFAGWVSSHRRRWSESIGPYSSAWGWWRYRSQWRFTCLSLSIANKPVYT